MARRKLKIKQRNLEPDFQFGSLLVARLINKVILHGKRSVAQRLVYDSFDIIKRVTNSDPIAIFELAVENVRPRMEVRSRRVGGTNYQIPREVDYKRSLSLAFMWILKSARSKSGKSMSSFLSSEIMVASKKEGAAYKKCIDVHRIAESNKAFAHYRW